MIFISIIVFSLFIAFVWIKYDVQTSISESYNRMKDEVYHVILFKKHLFKLYGDMIFTLSLWGFAIPIMIAGDTLLMFIAGSGICFVGAAADFDRYLSNRIWHLVGAFTGIGAGLASMWVDFKSPEIVFLALIVSGLIYLKVKKNYIWWIQILVYCLISLKILIK